MAPSSKNLSASRRKSAKGIVILKVSPKALQRLLLKLKVNEENSISSLTPKSNDLSITGSSTTENTVSSKSRTPDQPDTPSSTSMLPPAEVTKKKSNKRASIAAFGSESASGPKIRGKPGPKKRSKLDDTPLDTTSTIVKTLNTSAIKLGPKANQGAINAGLRALDRSGKPCRKWVKESFKLKSFTGVCWEIPRWKAFPKNDLVRSEADSESISRFTDSKGNSQAESEHSEKSNNITDIEIGSTSSHRVCSPAQQPLAIGGTITTSALSSPVSASA